MKHRIVVFEGCDCSGKTTLRQAYDKKTNFHSLVIDRMYVSSFIYNEVRDRHADLKKELENEFHRFINEFNPLFVIRHPSLEIIKRRFTKRGDWLIKHEELEKIYKLYSRFAEGMQFHENFLILDDDREIDEHIDEIIKALKRG